MNCTCGTELKEKFWFPTELKPDCKEEYTVCPKCTRVWNRNKDIGEAECVMPPGKEFDAI